MSKSPTSPTAEIDDVLTLPKQHGATSWIDSLTGGNQFMSAGLGVMAIGASLAVARQSVKKAAAFAKHQMLGK